MKDFALSLVPLVFIAILIVWLVQRSFRKENASADSSPRSDSHQLHSSHGSDTNWARKVEWLDPRFGDYD